MAGRTGAVGLNAVEGIANDRTGVGGEKKVCAVYSNKGMRRDNSRYQLCGRPGDSERPDKGDDVDD